MMSSGAQSRDLNVGFAETPEWDTTPSFHDGYDAESYGCDADKDLLCLTNLPPGSTHGQH
jgi:hypothetical protein